MHIHHCLADFRRYYSKKRSSRGRYLRRRASASILILYQISAEISIIWPRFVIIISFLICFLDFICETKNFLILSSREFFIRDVSIIILGDCFKAFLSKCSREFALADLGDFISNSVPSSKMSAVCRFDSSRNNPICGDTAWGGGCGLFSRIYLLLGEKQEIDFLSKCLGLDN